MNRPRLDVRGPRAGIAAGDLMLVLSALALVAALAYPRISGIRWNRNVRATVAVIDTVVAAAGRYHAALNAWPPPTRSGTIPAELAPYLPSGSSFEREGFTLTWERWERVASSGPEPAPDLGGAELPVDSVEVAVTVISEFAGLTVSTVQEPLLAALLDHYGSARSFLRDSTWTLVLPPPA